MSWLSDHFAEWLEADGMGGYAMGTVGGRRTRRYHAQLLVATHPPTGRMVLVNGADVFVTLDGEAIPLSTQLYTPYVVAPDNDRWLDEFSRDPWPTWTYQLPDGSRLRHELWLPRGLGACCQRWSIIDRGTARIRELRVRPFLSGRDHHGLHRENPVFQMTPQDFSGAWTWKPYPGVPSVTAIANAKYRHDPVWYRNFLYEQERERGLDDIEDLAAPGEWTWPLDEPAVLIWTTDHGLEQLPAAEREQPVRLAEKLDQLERSRRSALGPGRKMADPYLIETTRRSTIVAGYPWFTDWGRDTFIALRGLCLSQEAWKFAGEVLLAWSTLVSDGMLPNRFPDEGLLPEFNSVDASLWFVVVVREFLAAVEQAHWPIEADQASQLNGAVAEILAGYARGTRFGIRLEPDGLIAAGEPGVQLTWMDAKVGSEVITPRIGKPVEIQALWLNALAAFPQAHPSAQAWLERGLASFRARFWNESAGCLHDVVDENHHPGQVDSRIRPNQLLALGGLPLTLTLPKQTARAMAVVEEHLLTPMGLRTLSPSDPDYLGRYQGGPRSRDGAYHQGTVWPWLLDPFVVAWLKLHEVEPAAKEQARQRFLLPLQRHLREAGLDHVSEIADGDTPHTPHGCPFQAWSDGSYLRLVQLLQSDAGAARNA